MFTVTKTIKVRLFPTEYQECLLDELMCTYRDACNYISSVVFENDCRHGLSWLNDMVYSDVRRLFGLKSQLTQSAIKTVISKYDTVETQIKNHPYGYTDSKNRHRSVGRDLNWLCQQVWFSKPQADLVRGRDYDFKEEPEVLSMNTLGKRILVRYEISKYYSKYLSAGWDFGTGKIVKRGKDWYFHVSISKDIEKEFPLDNPDIIVGIDRGLRFPAVTYDDSGKVRFISGKNIQKTRDKYDSVRAELQSKGTKSAKRVLKRLSERESRWMSDVNHQISKTLVQFYGPGTLFAIEDLSDLSLDDKNLKFRNAEERHELRSWSFYQLEQYLTCKAAEAGCLVVKVNPKYTSQRCPKCGRILKKNRKHETHEYICDRCKYRSNDDRTAAMNIRELGLWFAFGIEDPSFSQYSQAKRCKPKNFSAGSNPSEPQGVYPPAESGYNQLPDDADADTPKSTLGASSDCVFTSDASCKSFNLEVTGGQQTPFLSGAG